MTNQAVIHVPNTHESFLSIVEAERSFSSKCNRFLDGTFGKLIVSLHRFNGEDTQNQPEDWKVSTMGNVISLSKVISLCAFLVYMCGISLTECPTSAPSHVRRPGPHSSETLQGWGRTKSPARLSSIAKQLVKRQQCPNRAP
jgi:hypothetical protein